MQKKKTEEEEEAQGPWLSDYIASSTWRMNNSDTRHNESPDELVLCSKCSHPGTDQALRLSKQSVISPG